MARTIERVEKSIGGAVTSFEVGVDGVKVIGEKLPIGPGDVCYYEAVMDDDTVHRLFYPDYVRVSKDKKIEAVKAPPLIIP